MEQRLRIFIGENSLLVDPTTANLKVPLPALVNSHTRGRPYKCQLCTSSFHTECSLKSHMRTHTGEKPFQCKICKKAFAQANNLKYHMNTHTKEKSQKVNLSAITYSHTNNMNSEAGMNCKEKPFKCQLCESWFTRISNLKVHQRSHTGEKSPMEKHLIIKIQSGDKTSYRCGICSKVFAHYSSMHRHLRNHKDDKHEDDHRDVSQSNQNIGNSDQIQIEKKPLQCYFCPSAFLSLGDLEKHMQIHTNGTPASRQCDESHSNQDIYNSDQIQIEKKPLQCYVCSSAFERLEDLQKHLLVHNGKYEKNQCNETQSNQDICNSDLLKIENQPVSVL